MPLSPRSRGSALILVVVALVLLLMIGVAFVSGAKQDRLSGRAAMARGVGDQALEALAESIGAVIAQDALEADGPALADADDLDDDGDTTEFIGGEGDDAPDLFDAWLSSPAFRNTGAPNGRFRRGQISRLFPGKPFVSVLNPYQDATIKDSYDRPGSPATAAQLAKGFRDAYIPNLSTGSGAIAEDPWRDPGSGSANRFEQRRRERDALARFTRLGPDTPGELADAKYVRLDVPNSDGLTWLAAVRVVDSSSMVNVNTATQTFLPPTTQATGPGSPVAYAPGGATLTAADAEPSPRPTPADADLFGLLYQPQANDSWQDHWGAAAGGINFFTARGLTPFPRVHEESEREAVWENYARDLGESYPHGRPGFGVFGPATEATLRGAGGGFVATSELKASLTGYAYDGSDRLSKPLNAFRPYLTTWSNSRQIRLSGGSTDWHVPTPGWLDFADGGGFDLTTFQRSYDGAGAGNPIPANKTDAADLSGTPAAAARALALFKAVLTLPTLDMFADPAIPEAFPYLGVGPHRSYGYTAARAAQAAGCLAASLQSWTSPARPYREADGIDDGGAAYHGLEFQPFFTEAVTIVARQDRLGGTAVPPGDPPPPATDPDADLSVVGVDLEPPHGYFLVELRNPFDEPAVVYRGGATGGAGQYRLRIDGGWPVPATAVEADLRPLPAVGVGYGDPAADITLGPGDRLILFSAAPDPEGVMTRPMLEDFAFARAGKAPGTDDPLAGGTKLLAVDLPIQRGSGNPFTEGRFELVALDPDDPGFELVVDRLRPPGSAGLNSADEVANYPALPPPDEAIESPGSTDGDVLLTASSLQRDTRLDDFMPRRTLGGIDDPAIVAEAPNYVYESPAANGIVLSQTAGTFDATKRNPVTPAGIALADAAGGTAGYVVSLVGNNGDKKGDVLRRFNTTGTNVLMRAAPPIDLRIKKDAGAGAAVDRVSELGDLFTVGHVRETDAARPEGNAAHRGGVFGELLADELAQRVLHWHSYPLIDNRFPLYDPVTNTSNWPTAPYSLDGSPPPAPVVEQARVAIAIQRFCSYMSGTGKPRLTEFVADPAAMGYAAGTPAWLRIPRIPVAAMLFDAVEVPVHDATDAVRGRSTPGRINLNTASEAALSALPMFPYFRAHAGGFVQEGAESDGSPFYGGITRSDGSSYAESSLDFNPATAIAHYRDLADDAPARFGLRRPVEGGAARPRGITGVYGIREEPGFSGLGELLAVRQEARVLTGPGAGLSAYEANIDALALDGFDTSQETPTSGPLDHEAWWNESRARRSGPVPWDPDARPWPDRADDTRESLGLFGSILPVLTTRSDSYVVYAELVGVRYDPNAVDPLDDPGNPAPPPPGLWKREVTRRFVALLDRSLVGSTDAAGRVITRPETLLFLEVPPN